MKRVEYVGVGLRKTDRHCHMNKYFEVDRDKNVINFRLEFSIFKMISVFRLTTTIPMLSVECTI